MMDVNRILEYVPTKHGEHGIDSVIHRATSKNLHLFESYSNPPGASWAEVIIQNPTTQNHYSWDHIPRKPNCAKRPDVIIQFNYNNKMNLLEIESKEKILNIYNNIDELLKNFFTGATNFNGLFNRPTQHRKNPETEKWEYVGNDNTLDVYWVQKIQTEINLYSGFAFGFEPEFYDKIESFDEEKWNNKMEKIMEKYSLDVVIGIGWHGIQHMPFVKLISNKIFSQTLFYSHLKSSLI